MKELLIEVQASEFKEYERAAAKFGKANNSPHESYAVILEEFQEAKTETERFNTLRNWYWAAVKSNDTAVQKELLVEMRAAAEKAAGEWIQVAAMCYKATIPKEEQKK